MIGELRACNSGVNNLLRFGLARASFLGFSHFCSAGLESKAGMMGELVDELDANASQAFAGANNFFSKPYIRPKSSTHPLIAALMSCARGSVQKPRVGIARRGRSR
ncbi:MAG TPA: hypothetical protein VID27_18065, partial [Blastocatellia bacterium]